MRPGDARNRVRLGPAMLAAAGAVTGQAVAQEATGGQRPMGYLESFGSPGAEIAPLTWALLWLSVGVVVLISALVGLGLLRRARPGHAIFDDRSSVRRAGNVAAMRWIYLGLALTTLILIAFTFWTVTVLASISQPDEEPVVTIDVTGHQWWWELTYTSPDRPTFQTANEIYVPVGEPVRFRLSSADVIHSFWVPALGGKTDLIPGQTNAAWLEADAPGVYRGQCAEYCGLQHAHMALRVVALPRDEFDRWWDRQIQVQPAALESAEAGQGQRVFLRRCSACHTVRGTLAHGEMGPDLTHLMTRSTLASAMIPNTKGHLAGWIANPEHLKPGTPMPNLDIPGPQFNALLEYVLTLE